MSKIIALDPGTAFFQTAEYGEKNEIKIKTMRNAFVELGGFDDIEQILEQNKWKYVRDENKYFIIGDDSIVVSRMFPGKVDLRRPMADGVLNKNENEKMKILAKMIELMIGKAPDEKSLVCSCISAECINEKIDNTFHQARLEGMIQRLGWKTKIIEEGHAVILSENPSVDGPNGEKIPFSGISAVFGGGRANCSLSFRGVKVISCSVNNCGDKIDERVAEETGIPIQKVIHIKENLLNFDKLNQDDDVLFALDVFYSSMLENVFKNFSVQFKKVKSEFDMPLSIVLAGGTSCPPGFKNKAEKVIRSLDLPFKIKQVIQSEDPRNSVVKGLLIQATISHKKLGKEENNNSEF